MNDYFSLPPAAEHLEGHVAIALAQALALLAADPGRDHPTAPAAQAVGRGEPLLREIDRRTIVSERGANELEALIDRIENEAANGTTSTTTRALRSARRR